MTRVRLSVAAVAFLAVLMPVGAQPDRGGEAIPCPAPITQTIPVSMPTTNPNNDFAAGQWSAPRAGLNDSGANKHFLGVFNWKPEKRCCQITWARLTVQMKANRAGTSATAPDAGNDGINVMAAGNSVKGQPVYSTFPFAAGQTATFTWTLDAAALARLNQGKGLSFDVQDDTMVTGAMLEVRGCCLNAM